MLVTLSPVTGCLGRHPVWCHNNLRTPSLRRLRLTLKIEATFSFYGKRKCPENSESSHVSIK
ncbi:hypothetical protein BBBOND_0104400 [Babesia bigemina]|uniref:Uncharacterized protein n=1 Tax=Babesia bigemina TaxID=5866 RepID=A0A061CZU1_BABBI|nr:hypothetical protein BBBOND_0104400 [Babesia bigemina]CDR94131.1 hypothetical protein BBBOND_0104400 [Babesia bigemina]|eukprot:XP_012766317.1 hypothetical protein BBBOND_0104400 [Babesia bigemina]